MPESSGKNTLVLLDFAGTLMEEDTFLAFLIFRLKEFRIVLRSILALPYFIAFQFKLMDNSKAKEKVFGMLFKGEKQLDFERKAQEFWDFQGTNLNPAINDLISNYQKEGAELMIVSANFNPIIAAFSASAYRFNDFLCTELETEGDRLTGRFASPNCHGEEKVRRLKIRFPDRSVFSEIHAYGDSNGDLPMLRWADRGYLLQKGEWQKI